MRIDFMTSERVQLPTTQKQENIPHENKNLLTIYAMKAKLGNTMEVKTSWCQNDVHRNL